MAPSLRRCVVVLFVMGAPVTQAAAQPDDPPRLELHVGSGYLDARASREQSPPSGGTVELGVVGWLTDHWGVAARHTRPPTAVYNRTYLEGRTWVDNADGRYTAITARYRRFTDAGIELSIGLGWFSGSYVRREILRYPDHEERWRRRRVPGVGFTAELLLGYRLFRHLGVKAGVAVGGPLEMRFAQPWTVAVLSF